MPITYPRRMRRPASMTTRPRELIGMRSSPPPKMTFWRGDLLTIRPTTRRKPRQTPRCGRGFMQLQKRRSEDMLPYLHLMPRVERDIDECLEFIARQPWGKPTDREADICLGIGMALLRPESNRVE